MAGKHEKYNKVRAGWFATEKVERKAFYIRTSEGRSGTNGTQFKDGKSASET